MSALHYLLSFAVALGILITVHEFGHFFVARRVGVKVLRFSIGFGKAIWSRRFGADDTELVIAAVPLGGYVKMVDERNEEPIPEQDLPRAFNRQSLVSRIAVVVAGPVFNWIFAILAYWALFTIGIAGAKPIMGTIVNDSLAQKAGLKSGYEVIAVDGETAPTWEALFDRVLQAVQAGRPSISVLARSTDGVSEQAVNLDLSGVDLNDVIEGSVFSKLGIHSAPRVPPIIGRITPDGAAAAAGLRAGDKLIEIEGKPLRYWDEWVDVIKANPDRTLLVRVEREGQTQDIRLTPARTEVKGQVIGRIGAEVAQPRDMGQAPIGVERYGPVQSLTKSLDKTLTQSLLMLRMLTRMVSGQSSLKNMGGPISIAQAAGQSANVGVSKFVEFLAFVSISLAVLNMLPVPLLDGGHLLYYLIEFVRGGKPMSEMAQSIGQQIGLALLIGLMGVAFYNDVARVFAFR
jgi:regulator of sigma E protease